VPLLLDVATAILFVASCTSWIGRRQESKGTTNWDHETPPFLPLSPVLAGAAGIGVFALGVVDFIEPLLAGGILHAWDCTGDRRRVCPLEVGDAIVVGGIYDGSYGNTRRDRTRSEGDHQRLATTGSELAHRDNPVLRRGARLRRPMAHRRRVVATPQAPHSEALHRAVIRARYRWDYDKLRRHLAR
jgi:hypothetical protein